MEHLKVIKAGRNQDKTLEVLTTERASVKKPGCGERAKFLCRGPGRGERADYLSIFVIFGSNVCMLQQVSAGFLC